MLGISDEKVYLCRRNWPETMLLAAASKKTNTKYHNYDEETYSCSGLDTWL